MAWKPGQSGNPEGGAKEQIVRAQLMRACVQEDYARVRKLVEKTLDLAAEGEQWAVNFIADRLDGKPRQAVDVDVRRSASDMDDASLTGLIAAGSSSRAAGASDSST